MEKFLKNIFSSSLPQIAGIITNFILPPLIIAQYGSEINGLISTSRVILGYIALVGAGISSAVTQSLYAPVSKGDDWTVKGMLHAASNMFNRYGLIYIFIMLVVSVFYPLFIKNFNQHFLVMLLLIVMSLSSISEFFAIGRCRALLYAHQKVYITSIIQSLGTLVGLLLAYILLQLKVNIVIVQFALSMAYVSRAFLLIWYIDKHYPQYHDFKQVPPISQAVRKRKNALVHQLAGLVVMGTQTAILTFLIGLDAASIYAVYNIIFAGVQSLCNSLNTSITPFLGKEYALHSIDKLRAMYNCLEYVYFCLVAFTYSVTMVMLLPFISLYTKKADINYEYPIFAALFTYVSSFYVLKIISSSLINAAGYFKETQGRAIIEASATLILSVLFTHCFGLIGVLIGTGIALGWRCIDSIWYANKYILKQPNLRSFFRASFVYFSITLACIFVQRNIITCDSYLAWVKTSCLISMEVLAFLLFISLLFEYKTWRVLVYYVRYRKLLNNVKTGNDPEFANSDK